jgi:phosphate transport system substrate-binding protein
MKPLLHTLFGLLAGLSVLFPAHTAVADPSDDPLMGAGAHFSWVVFNAIKEDLERKVGRKTILFGENSMLGMGCDAGIKAAKQATASHETFGFICCQLTKEEMDKEGLIEYPLAKEPIYILTHDSNPVTNLSMEEVRAIFRGDVLNWQEVGGPDKPIVVVTRLHCKDRLGYWKTILPTEKAFRQERLNVKSDAAVIETMNDFSGSIGFNGSTWPFKPEDHVKPVTINGVKATAANIENGSYPLYRILSAVTNRTPSVDVLKLINEAQTGPAFLRVAKQYEMVPMNAPLP